LSFSAAKGGGNRGKSNFSRLQGRREGKKKKREESALTRSGVSRRPWEGRGERTSYYFSDPRGETKKKGEKGGETLKPLPPSPPEGGGRERKKTKALIFFG